MSDSHDEEKIRAALDELEPWAYEEITRLKKQFEAREKSAYRPRRRYFPVGFFLGISCGLLISAMLLLWFYPQMCSHS